MQIALSNGEINKYFLLVSSVRGKELFLSLLGLDCRIIIMPKELQFEVSTNLQTDSYRLFSIKIHFLPFIIKKVDLPRTAFISGSKSALKMFSSWHNWNKIQLTQWNWIYSIKIGLHHCISWTSYWINVILKIHYHCNTKLHWKTGILTLSKKKKDLFSPRFRNTLICTGLHFCLMKFYWHFLQLIWHAVPVR